MNDQKIRDIQKYNIIVGLAYVILSLFFWSYSKTIGAAFGSAVMILNFSLMSFLIKKILIGGKIKIVPLVLYTAKFLVLIVLIFLIFKLSWVNKIFFILGTTVILVSLILASFIKGEEQESS